MSAAPRSKRIRNPDGAPAIVVRTVLLGLSIAMCIAATPARTLDGDGRLQTMFTDSLVDTMVGHYADAVDSLELLEDASEDPAFNRRAQRLLDRARRAVAFLDRLPELLSKRPNKAHPEIHFLDGDYGDYAGSDGQMLYVKIGGNESPISARELLPASIIVLSAPLALSAEDALGRAFVALSDKDHKTFASCIHRAASDSRLKAAIDSAIAYDRELDSVPPGGFVEVGGVWKTGAELALKAELGDPKRLFTQLRSPKSVEADAARTKLDELLRTNPDGLKAWAISRRDELRIAFEKAPEQRTLALLHERVSRMKQARDAALKLIFNETRYFYPCHAPECPPDKLAEYAEVQVEVDRLVAGVRGFWGDEAGPPPEPSISAPAFLDVVTELKALRSVLVQLELERDAVDQTLAPCWLLPNHGAPITIRNLAGDVYDVNRFSRDEPVVETNRAERARKDGPTAEELHQVEITNAYRAMFGRRQLLWNGKLYAAAHGHSDWMQRTGTFSHFEEEGSDRHEPSDRAKLAGYPGGAGENICFGESDALRAHIGWVHSSGHHRNILMADHTEMASSRAGNYWTQNFGGSLEYKQNLVSKKK